MEGQGFGERTDCSLDWTAVCFSGRTALLCCQGTAAASHRVQTHRATGTDSFYFAAEKVPTAAQVYESIVVIFSSQQLHKCAQ